MRVTIDCDRKVDALSTLLKGLNKINKLPDEIRISARGNGFHFIWFNACISEQKCYEIRKFIGDDKKRIKIDSNTADKPKQILWNSKKMPNGKYLEAKNVSINAFMEMIK